MDARVPQLHHRHLPCPIYCMYMYRLGYRDSDIPQLHHRHLPCPVCVCVCVRVCVCAMAPISTTPRAEPV